MKQKKEREKEISQWPWISMLPFGILAGYWGKREVRITAISEYGFQTRLAAPATAEQKNAPWELAFYDQKTAFYQRILLRDATFLQEKEEDFKQSVLSETGYSADITIVYSQDIKNSYYDTEQSAGKQMHTNTENRSEEVQGSHTSANGLYQTAKQLIRLLMEL